MSFTTIPSRALKFNPIDPNERRQNLGTFLTIRRNDIYMSVSLWDQIGMPDAIVFAIEEKEKLIGMKGTDKDDPIGFKIIPNNKLSGFRIGGITNIRERIIQLVERDIDFDSNNLILWRPVMMEEYLCFNPRFAEIKPIRKVKKKKE